MFCFSNKLKLLRQKCHLTQEELANEVGVTKSMISAYERGLRMPSYDIMVHLANLFHVSTDYLLGLENENLLDLSGLTAQEKQAIRDLVQVMRFK